jgi:hypothetical protein
VAEQDGNQDQYRRLTHDDLERIVGEPLPERVATSLLKAHVAIPTNLAWATDDLSEGDGSSSDRHTPMDRSA